MPFLGSFARCSTSHNTRDQPVWGVGELNGVVSLPQTLPGDNGQCWRDACR